ncbi:hypothetical protein SAMN05216327_105130 [Dyadobacter sp. SG02]|uniref:DUF5691 domain-containing protein n=1 Tax=Dyadobacter sp. SG02 TaxID=1855291 RepID=UPI0008C07C57|nr:DUF5691 domain-containing protein [Dyadobacter sp. SG02]SEI98702.1 hypothetical protein SAMN05216327_105130 [Dyadobacter sp. SG02]
MNTEILKAALLGTDRHMPDISKEAPEIYTRINALPTSKEDRFLKMAFTSIIYEEAGTKPVTIDAHLPECPAESRTVVTGQLAALLQSAMKDQNDVLFGFLVFRIVQRNEVVQPQLVPALLNKALERKNDKEQLLGICGMTGQWLCDLNPQWKVLRDGTRDEENVWETGSTESRKTFLTALRKTDPNAAIALLEGTLSQENANNRLAFLQLLNDGLSLSDEPFLQKLLTDKSQKVRETVVGMLRQIQGSAVNRSHFEWLLRMIGVQEERHLLVTKKKKLVISDAVMPDESIFKTGVERVSTEKGVQDHVFIAGQLLSAIDPAALSESMELTDQQSIGLFLEHPAAKALLPFLTSAAVQFRNKAWALALLHRGDARDIGLLNALTPVERLPFYLQFLNGNASNLFAYLLDDAYSPLPIRLAEQLLDHLSKFPYHITQPVYQRLALQLPAGIMPVLKKYAEDPRQDYQLRYFKNQMSEMMRLVELKKNIA